MKYLFTIAACLCLYLPAGAQIREKTAKAAKPFVLGRIENIYSRELSEYRTLNIYLPPGYREEDTTHYPVIYLLDGAADEDFIHVVGLVQFNNFSWIRRLPECIVVGIANKDRKRDFTFPTTVAEDQKSYPTSGHSAAFISFLGKELQPFIQKRYRGNKKGMLIGQSLGGLLATEILLKHTSLFDKYVIISPSLWWDNGSLLQEKTKESIEKQATNTSVYIAVGKEGLTPGKSPRVMEVDANLLADQLKSMEHEKPDVYFDYLPGEDHATITHQAVFNAFRALYPAQGKDR
jgi:predicted alpha/beta superfamily hydrolase